MKPGAVQIYKAVDTLVAAGLLEDSQALAFSTEDAWETKNIIDDPFADPYATRNFELTDKGLRHYDALIRELPANVEQDLSSFKERFASIPLRQLIRYVYERHPDYTDADLGGDRRVPW